MLKIFALLFASVSMLSAQSVIDWRCAFTGCGADKGQSERTEICDLPVPSGFVLIYGFPPEGAGCLSNHDKVEYFSKVEKFVEGSDRLLGGPSAEVFLKWGLGDPLGYEMDYGTSGRRPQRVAFPGKVWEGPVPAGYNLQVAERYPFPIIYQVQGTAIKGGACIPEQFLPPVMKRSRFAKINKENCK